MRLDVKAIRVVAELYPRAKQDDAAIERYRASLDRLPPIVVARGGILVDGFHRLQARKREGADEVEVEDLGDLSDAEILRESIQRNATHGQQLSQADKQRLAGKLWLSFADMKVGERTAEIAGLLSVSERSVQAWSQDARRSEKQQAQARAYDLWLNCLTEREIGDELGISRDTIHTWIVDSRDSAEINNPDPLPHADVWSFQKATEDGDANHFGRMPGQVVENLLWLYTEPGDVVVDPFAGGGTTIDVAKRMGRRVWASDLTPTNDLLPIHEHDIASGWPASAPGKAKLILLDPPYATQAKGRYSESPDDLGNMTYDAFLEAWAAIVAACVRHLAEDGVLAFIIGSTLIDKRPVNHADDMLPALIRKKMRIRQRVIVPYSSEQLNGNIVTLAREGRYLLATYRDLVVLER